MYHYDPLSEMLVEVKEEKSRCFELLWLIQPTVYVCQGELLCLIAPLASNSEAEPNCLCTCRVERYATAGRK